MGSSCADIPKYLIIFPSDEKLCAFKENSTVTSCAVGISPKSGTSTPTLNSFLNTTGTSAKLPSNVNLALKNSD